MNKGPRIYLPKEGIRNPDTVIAEAMRNNEIRQDRMPQLRPELVKRGQQSIRGGMKATGGSLAQAKAAHASARTTYGKKK